MVINQQASPPIYGPTRKGLGRKRYFVMEKNAPEK